MEEILKSLETDLKYYNDAIREVAQDILSSNFSKYPVFVACRHSIELGEMILDARDFGKKWSITATIMEELIEKGIIDPNKAEGFKSIYKDPSKFICVLLVEQKLANFVFIPYQNKIKSKQT